MNPLTAATKKYMENHNQNPQVFVWKTSAPPPHRKSLTVSDLLTLFERSRQVCRLILTDIEASPARDSPPAARGTI